MWWDWSSPWLYAGAGCVAAAIVGGGIKAFGQEIPVVNSYSRQVVLAIFGLVLILAPQLMNWKKAQEIEHDKLRVDRVEASLDRQTYWGCNVDVTVKATIVMRGQNGTVPLALEARWGEVHPELDPSEQKNYTGEQPFSGLIANDSGNQTDTVTIPFEVRQGAPTHTDYKMVVHLSRPVEMVSNEVPFSIQCDS
jgi:hypothetical protein